MIDDRSDPNRPPDRYGEPPLGRDLMGPRPLPDDGTGWGIFAALAIIAVVIGGLFWYGAAHERNTSTANYQPPAQIGAPATPSAADPPVRPSPPGTK